MIRSALPLLLVASLAMAPSFAEPAGPGSDVNAAPSGVPKQGTQSEAEATFAKARAECRGESRDTKRECVKDASKDIDKNQRMVKPPRKDAPKIPSQ